MNSFHVCGRIDGHHFTSIGVYNILEMASLNVKAKSVLSVMLWRQIWFRICQILFVQSLWWPLGHHQLCPCQQWLTVNCDSLIVRVGVNAFCPLADVSTIPWCHSDKKGVPRYANLIPGARAARIKDSAPIQYRLLSIFQHEMENSKYPWPCRQQMIVKEDQTTKIVRA